MFLTTFCGIFSHYFTAFSYLFIYLYLVAVIWQQDRKQIWKPFVCGGSVVLLFVAWLIKSDFFHLLVSDGNPTNRSKFGIYEFFDFIFGTGVKYATKMGELLFVLTLVCAILFWKRLGRRNGVFAVLCTCIFPVSYLMAALLALHASHFLPTAMLCIAWDCSGWEWLSFYPGSIYRNGSPVCPSLCGWECRPTESLIMKNMVQSHIWKRRRHL